MKKLYLSVIMLLCVAMAASAADFGGKKFYINPGHGGHDSNDRPTPLPCGVEMFYESDGNLDRGIHLRDMFTANNAKVKMSRTKNTSSDDLGLSTIASYANTYGGYFMSLHSNGANASANYVVSFFRTSKSSPTTNTISGSKTMAQKVSNWHDAVTLSDQTYGTPRALGDYSFYGYNLGVLRTNNCVGYLVESWFHDYRPEALRMKSTVYNKFLAWQILRAAMDSPGATGSIGSVVSGDIRDLSQSCGYTNYTTRNRDKYKAVEGATVTLLSSAGAELQTMTTDNCENGFYAFFDLSAGTYQVRVAKDGYKTLTKSFTVGTSAQTMLKFDLEQGSDTGISVNPSTAAFGQVTTGTNTTKTITVTTTDVTADISISSNNTMFKVSTATLSASGGTFVITYAPTEAGSHTGVITLKSGDFTRTIVATGTAKNAPLAFTEIWNYSETSGVDKDWTTDKTKIRNFAYGNGKLYVVNAADSEIVIVNARTGDKEGTVNTEGVSGGALKLMDVEYVDGKLLATNLGTSTEALKVYVWNNGVDAAPSVLLETSDVASASRIGDTFSVKGNLTNGSICYVAGGTSEKNKIVTYAISGGVASTTPVSISVSTDGTDDGNIVIGLSPRVVPETSGKYWVMGQNYYPSLVSAEGLLESTLNPVALNSDNAGNTFAPFTFKGTQYAFATSYTPASAAADRLKNGRAILVDGSDGWATAENIGEYPAAGLGATRNTTFSGNIEVNVNGDEGVEMWVLCHNQGIAYYRHGTASSDDNTGDNTGNEGTPAEPGSVGAMTEVWNYSLNTTTPSYLDLTTNYVRSIAFNDGKLYVLQNKAWAAPEIDILDAYTGEHKGNLDVTGIGSATIQVSSLVTVDGKILGASTSTTTQTLRVYQWNDDTSAPEVILEDATHAGEIMGSKLSFSGDLTNGKLWFTNDGVNKAIYYTVANGKVNTTANVINLTTDGTTAFAGGGSRGPAQVCVNSDGTFWVAGKDAYPTLFNASGVKQAAMQSGALAGNACGTAMEQFYYNGHQYVAATTYAEKLANGKFVVINVDNGISAATAYEGIYPSAGLGATTNEQCVNTLVVDVRGDGAVLDIWVCVSQQGVAYYTCGKAAVPGDNTGGNSAIETVDEDVTAPVEYYNLQGVRVANPENGLYIKKQGKKVTKVILR